MLMVTWSSLGLWAGIGFVTSVGWYLGMWFIDELRMAIGRP